MTRKLLPIVLILLSGPAALAAKGVTIDQFEQQLQSLHGKSKGFVTHRIQAVELTQRATPARLAEWLAEFPDKHVRRVLVALADSAAFLEIPASDRLLDNEPGADEQQAILARALRYVEDSIHLLPNFEAKRSTLRFDDSLDEPKNVLAFGEGDFLSLPTPERKVHYVGDLLEQVSYLHGTESLNGSEAERKRLERSGLTTWGEFGPILSVILIDSRAGQLTWKCWQKSDTGALAVFQYTVPRGKSHYLVSIRPRIKPQYPGYAGEIAIDPKTGSIARVTMSARLDVEASRSTANIAVEYGPVSLGQRTYICPVHAVAVSSDVDVEDAGHELTQINDVEFTDYHLFRGDVRIVPEQSEPQ